MKIFHTLFPIFLILFLLTGCREEHPGVRFDLEAGNFDRVRTPVALVLPDSLADFLSFEIENTETGTRVPGQLDGNELVFILDTPLPAGSVRNYRIIPSNQRNESTSVRVAQNDGVLSVTLDGRPVLDYQLAVAEPPEGEPSYYRRSGFIHPFYSPQGQVITDDFPRGHRHQHGIFYSYCNTTFQGRDVEFWNQQEETGTNMHRALEETVSGPVFARFSTQIDYLDLTDADTTVALHERWTVTVYRISDYFVADLVSTQSTAGPDTLTINEYHYGGMAVRGSDQWNDTEYQQPEENPVNYVGENEAGFLTSEGKTRIEGNHSRPRWVDLHGRVDGVEVGITAMGHPSNFRHPQPVRIHPTMPYFTFAPMVLGTYSIDPGTELRSTYRFISHMGRPDTEQIEAVWHDFSNPPTVRLHF